MYINKPLIKVERMRQPSRLTTGTRTAQKKKFLKIIRQVQEVENNWVKLLKNSEDEIEKARKQQIQVENDEAFIQCQNLLDEEYQTEQEKFAKVRRQVKVNMQTAEEHIQLCEVQKKERAHEIERLKAEIEQLENEQSTFGKKVKRKHEMRQKIEDYAREIENASIKLQNSKEKSYEQKGLYLQTQQLQMNLQEQIGKVEDDQKVYYQYRNREEKYKQLSRIVQKLHAKTNAGSKDVEGYLKEKINEMAHLRSNLVNLDQKLEEYNVSIEEQYYIMEGLKRRSTSNEREEEDQIYKKYQNKYEQLYFSRNNDINNWKNYKVYLQELLQKDNGTSMNIPRGTFSDSRKHKRERTPLRRTSNDKRYSRLRTEPLSKIEEEVQDSRVNRHFDEYRTPQRHRNYTGYSDGRGLHLPKIVQMNGRDHESGKIKENVKRMINESDVSLQSVNSDEALSGEIIEVEFHK